MNIQNSRPGIITPCPFCRERFRIPNSHSPLTARLSRYQSARIHCTHCTPPPHKPTHTPQTLLQQRAGCGGGGTAPNGHVLKRNIIHDYPLSLSVYHCFCLPILGRKYKATNNEQKHKAKQRCAPYFHTKQFTIAQIKIFHVILLLHLGDITILQHYKTEISGRRQFSPSPHYSIVLVKKVMTGGEGVAAMPPRRPTRNKTNTPDEKLEAKSTVCQTCVGLKCKCESKWKFKNDFSNFFLFCAPSFKN